MAYKFLTKDYLITNLKNFKDKILDPAYLSKDTTHLSGDIPTSAINAPNGVAGVNEHGMIPAELIPGGYDDVLEFPSMSEFPTTGEKGILYIAEDENIAYRWTGTTYIALTNDLDEATLVNDGYMTKEQVGLLYVDEGTLTNSLNEIYGGGN